jgi:hypothetical protein
MRHLLTLVAVLSLSACLHAGGPPSTVIKPSPMACISAQAAQAAEAEAHKYLEALIAAQRDYVCQEAPIVEPPAFVPPALAPSQEVDQSSGP